MRWSTLALSKVLGPRRLTLPLGAAAQLAAGACTGYGGAVRPGYDPAPADVRVRFAAPRAVTAVSPDGERLAVPGLTELRGLVTDARGDTLVLRVQSLTPEIDRAAERRGWVVRVVRQPGDRVEVRQFDPGRSAVLVGGLIALVVGAVAVATTNCIPYCG